MTPKSETSVPAWRIHSNSRLKNVRHQGCRWMNGYGYLPVAWKREPVPGQDEAVGYLRAQLFSPSVFGSNPGPLVTSGEV
jgi:hypothetical protein